MAQGDMLVVFKQELEEDMEIGLPTEFARAMARILADVDPEDCEVEHTAPDHLKSLESLEKA